MILGRNVTITSAKRGVAGRAEMGFSGAGMALRMGGDGVLRMGVSDPKETAYTWSHTSLAVVGKLSLFHFELLADMRDMSGIDVGSCSVELLPGVHNVITVSAALARAR
jgi:hypothetical protein